MLLPMKREGVFFVDGVDKWESPGTTSFASSNTMSHCKELKGIIEIQLEEGGGGGGGGYHTPAAVVPGMHSWTHTLGCHTWRLGDGV